MVSHSAVAVTTAADSLILSKYLDLAQVTNWLVNSSSKQKFLKFITFWQSYAHYSLESAFVEAQCSCQPAKRVAGLGPAWGLPTSGTLVIWTYLTVYYLFILYSFVGSVLIWLQTSKTSLATLMSRSFPIIISLCSFARWQSTLTYVRSYCLALFIHLAFKHKKPAIWCCYAKHYVAQHWHLQQTHTACYRFEAEWL